MKHSESTSPTKAMSDLETEMAALENFLSERVEAAESAAADCLALQAAMTAAEWAELDAALDGWFEKRAKADREAA